MAPEREGARDIPLKKFEGLVFDLIPWLVDWSGFQTLIFKLLKRYIARGAL